MKAFLTSGKGSVYRRRLARKKGEEARHPCSWGRKARLGLGGRIQARFRVSGLGL